MACVSKTDYKRRLRESPPEIFHTQHLQKTHSSEDSEVKKHADRVKRTLDYLGLRWWEDVVKWPLNHPYLTLVVAAYPLLFILWFLMFWVHPQWLLVVNEK